MVHFQVPDDNMKAVCEKVAHKPVLMILILLLFFLYIKLMINSTLTEWYCDIVNCY